MPKNKKANKKDAFYFFAKEIMEAREKNGYKFYRGIRELLENADVRKEYLDLSDAEKIKYDNLATEYKDERTNPHKKFTTTGETYAEIRARQEQENYEINFMNNCIKYLTSDSEHREELDTRDFVIMNANIVCEVPAIPQPEIWPVELSIIGFNLFYGIKQDYTTLIDTETVPVGFASAANDMHDETMLPVPGSDDFQPQHRDYKQILRKIRSYITKFVVPYEGKYPIFAMPEDIKLVNGSIQWLLKHATFDSQEVQDDIENFYSSVRYYKLTSLLLGLANAAGERDRNYHSRIKLGEVMEEGATHLLNITDYDFMENITCSFHCQEQEQRKMKRCTRNRVRKRIYLMLDELIKPMGIPERPAHDINKSSMAKPYRAPIDLIEETQEPTNSTDEPSTKRPRTSSGNGHIQENTNNRPRPRREESPQTSNNNPRTDLGSPSSNSPPENETRSTPGSEFGYIPPRMGRGASNFEESLNSNSRPAQKSQCPEFGTLPPGFGRGRPFAPAEKQPEPEVTKPAEFGSLPSFMRRAK